MFKLSDFQTSEDLEFALKVHFITEAMNSLIKSDAQSDLSTSQLASEAVEQAEEIVDRLREWNYRDKQIKNKVSSFISQIEETTSIEKEEQNTGYIDIVFDGPPITSSNPNPRFVDINDEEGTHISVGGWVQREDEYWVLRIPRIIRK